MQTTLSKLTRGLHILAALGTATMSLPAVLCTGAVLAPATPVMAQDATQDTIILKSGQTISGKILEETPTEIRMTVIVAGIAGEGRYPKSDILEIIKATKAAGTPAAAPAAEKADRPPAATPDAGSDKKKVYAFELTGWFGEDISETPIRDAFNDARKMEADYIVVKVDNDWSLRRFGQLEDIKDDAGAFDELFRAERMESIFTEELNRWPKKPTVVIWVNKAMGGASFLPFLTPNIYFTSEGKMGGIGHLQAIFGSMGDKVVREKQFSLRLGHAEGKAIEGGFDPRIVRAMARDEYVLSYKFEGGKPVLLERMPESADEFLLTDDGQGPNGDDEETLARGEGNDCLTLKADIAYKLGISKGTADTLEDLIYQLGLQRTSTVLKGKGNTIMKSWREAVEDAKRTLPRLWKEFNQVEVKDPGGYQERTEARNKRKQILTRMQQILKKYEEAVNPREVGVPDWNQLETIKKRLELEQLADKPEKRR